MEVTSADKLSALPQISQRKLLDILDKIPGAKNVIIEASILKPLEHILGVSVLKSHGVEKIFKLTSPKINLSSPNVVFFIYSSLISLKHVCDFVNKDLAEKNVRSYHCIIMSRLLGSLASLVEQEGLHGKIVFHSYQWELIPLDSNVLSLENHSLFKLLFLSGDQSCLPSVARSIWTLKLLFGEPSTTVCIGEHSKTVDKFVTMLSDGLCSPCKGGDLSCFIVMDRNMDYVSTLLRGFTYTSLLDEVFKVKSGFLEIPGQKHSYSLNALDEVYAHIKNSHFSSVFNCLKDKSKALKEEYDRVQKMELAEMTVYVRESLDAVRRTKEALALHIDACEEVVRQLERSLEVVQEVQETAIQGLGRKETLAHLCSSALHLHVVHMLRLACLLSVTHDGLAHHEVYSLKSQAIQDYGYPVLGAFGRLKRASLLVEAGSSGLGGVAQVAQAAVAGRRGWAAGAHRLGQLPTSPVDLRKPACPSYVFGGAYIPLVATAVHLLATGQPVLLTSHPHSSIHSAQSERPHKSFLVYIIGGVTYAEVAALQLLETSLGVSIIIASTSITNGNKIIESCI